MVFALTLGIGVIAIIVHLFNHQWNAAFQTLVLLMILYRVTPEQ